MTRWTLTLFVLAVVVAGCGDGSGSKPGDTTPPARVLDLAGTVTNDSTITLTWTAPGDDASAGTADRYDLRWSPSSLTDQTWNSASRCDGVPEPAEAGSSEIHPVAGLPRNTPVRLAIKAVDEADNASALSNVVRLQLPSASPACSLSVASLDFGSIAPSESAEQSFTITNTGGGRLHGEITVQGDHFSVIEGAGTFDLRFRETRAATVRFAPGISGPAEGSVTLGIGGCGPIPCSGRGSGPYCIMDWDTLRFGDVYVGDHGTWRVTLTNRGDNWTVVTPQLEGCTGMRVPYDQSFTLQPGDSRFITVEFWPLVDGPVDCRLKLNALGECDEVALLGRGIGPSCWQSIDGRGYGPVAVGASVEAPFTIENRGGGVLEGTVSGGSPDFTITAGAGPYALHRGEGRVVRVRFAPQSAGEKACTIETGSDACRDVSLWGTGLGPECVVEPDTLDFGEIPIGSITESSFTITNRGVGPLTGVVPMQCGDFAVTDGWGSFSLGPNETKTCRVHFRPLTTGPHACALSLGLACEALALRGSATGEFCRVEPAILDFGTVPVRGDSVAEVTVTNVGAGIQLDLSVRFLTCPGFTIVRGGGAAYLERGEQHVVAVRFAPELAGRHDCTLDLGAATCVNVPIRGEGLAVVCDISPSAVDYGTIPLGAFRDTTLTVQNLGGGVLLAQPRLTCPGFSIQSGGGTFALEHGQSHTMIVRWRPTVPGPARCALWIGTTCDSVPLTGLCFDPPPVCAIDTDSLSFGLATQAHDGQELSFTIRNVGGQILRGVVTESSPDFEILSGAGPFELRHGSRTVTVRFRPATVGYHETMIATGSSDCPGVVCDGTGISYRVYAEMLRVDDIGRMSVNDGVTYTARFGKQGTDQTGYVDIGHYSGDSGLLDITPHCVPGTNRLRFTLENTGCCDASIHVVVQRLNEVFVDDDFTGNGHEDGVLFDISPTFEAVVE